MIFEILIIKTHIFLSEKYNQYNSLTISHICLSIEYEKKTATTRSSSFIHDSTTVVLCCDILIPPSLQYTVHIQRHLWQQMIELHIKVEADFF